MCRPLHVQLFTLYWMVSLTLCFRVHPCRLSLSKPVVAAVPGHAVAGGLELALLCGLRVSEEDAIFGVFCTRHGVFVCVLAVFWCSLDSNACLRVLVIGRSTNCAVPAHQLVCAQVSLGVCRLHNEYRYSTQGVL